MSLVPSFEPPNERRVLGGSKTLTQDRQESAPPAAQEGGAVDPQAREDPRAGNALGVRKNSPGRAEAEPVQLRLLQAEYQVLAYARGAKARRYRRWRPFFGMLRVVGPVTSGSFHRRSPPRAQAVFQLAGFALAEVMALGFVKGLPGGRAVPGVQRHERQVVVRGGRIGAQAQRLL